MKGVSLRTTSLTALAVLLLWGTSWALSYVDLGAWSLVVAFLIAAAKATLVVLFFMEIVLERVSIHATLVTGLAMVFLLIFFMVADVKTRALPPLVPPAARSSLR
jgi:cytochrome c oxidase subunit 4